MNSGYVVPVLGKEAFSCPHCGALAHQYWHLVGIDPYKKGEYPWVPRDDVIEKIEKNEKDAELKKLRIDLFKKILRKVPITVADEKWGTYLRIYNISVSKCYSCEYYTIWLYDKIIFPEMNLEITINEDCPDSVLPFLDEARGVYQKSARCAAAMLRLALQQLCVELGEKGKNINDDIGALVKKGLDSRIIKALDIVRIVGNGAVHPGEINFADNDETVLELFKLIDVITTAMISQPKKIDELFERLPEGSREAVKKRDGQ